MRPLLLSSVTSALWLASVGGAAAQEADDPVGATASEESDAVAATPDESPATEPDTAPAGEHAEAVPAPPTADRPKVAIVVEGDPDPAIRALARRVEGALSDAPVREVFDPGLRAALRGELSTEDDGLETVRRDRRRLGISESIDAPILAQLGRRAGAPAVAVLRSTPEGTELLMLDVARGGFFEGSLTIRAETSDREIATFVVRRARAAARHGVSPTPGDGTATPTEAPVEGAVLPAVRAGTSEEPAPEEEHEPDFFEEFWPYLAAGVLLAGMLTAIGIVASTESSTQPMLRFVPGGQ
ncbi:MAG: hypothetical protein AB7S26_06330 [Sandaracinaceae bacterium]